ncbi:MAG: GtrA family protein [Saprospiraceae bacterium]|nr:GtrA family protein [Saprospiraceae bacterium]MDW8229328.1 GtrA family protein [Saprospiraceae bacterium]
MSSLSSTVVDFGLFYVLFLATAHAGGSTFVGWSVSAVVAFYIQKHWVFGLHRATPLQKLGVRYGMGVLLGMALNVGGVWLLCDEMGLSPWFSRVSVALLAWYLIFLFNRYFVFAPSNES